MLSISSRPQCVKTSIDDPSVLLADGSDFPYLWYFHQNFFCQICSITVYCCDVVSEYIIPLLVSYLASPKFPLAKLVFSLLCQPLYIFIPPASMKLTGGYTGITLSVCPSVRPSVRLWTKSCPLCIFNNTHRIHFIFAHLIKQLKKVCGGYPQNAGVLVVLVYTVHTALWLYTSPRLMFSVQIKFILFYFILFYSNSLLSTTKKTLVTGAFSTQRASNVESIFMTRSRHVTKHVNTLRSVWPFWHWKTIKTCYFHSTS